MIWLLILLAVPAGWGVAVFNRLIRLRNRVRAAWSDIDVQLTRRHDLVPELVRTVRAYADHESRLLEDITRLRTEALGTDAPPRLAAVEEELKQALGRILLLKESYPDLKADANFRRLQHDLVDTENLLQYARRYYNGAVRELNTRIRQFPDLLVARLLGFEEARFYRAEEAHRPGVAVDLDRPA